ncbi:hypothetical protein DRP04_00050 [Archaeoglobales archaeon]|jgi:hypothetical protein|nr:MAG: hypothetical protein DRP04_00050 [Archaeoglobales archaeon]
MKIKLFETETRCLEWSESFISRWIGKSRSAVEKITLEGLTIAEDYDCPVNYEFVEDNTLIKAGCYGNDAFFIVKYPPYYTTQWASADVGVRCSDPASCMVNGMVAVDPESEIGYEDIAEKLKELGCEVEVDKHLGAYYIEFSCKEITEREVDKVIDITNDVVVKQWLEKFEDWCEAR